MNKELWQKFDKLRGLPFSGHEGLAEFFQKEGVRFASKDLAIWGQFFSTRLGRYGGEVHVPEWLVSVFSSLAQEASPKKICDPWAGIGFLIEALREACLPEQALAFTQNHEQHELGKVLVPEVRRQVGEPLHLLDSLPQSLDVVASILPMGVSSQRPLKVTSPTGEVLELADELGNLILVAASQRLSASGLGLFVVTPSFFKQHSVFHRFSELGLGMEAALALPSGTFAPDTNISTYLVIVRRKPSTRMFVGQLSADKNTNLQVIANFRSRTEGVSLELGRFLESQSFRGIDHLRVVEAIKTAKERFGFQESNLDQLGEVKSGIRLGRAGDGFKFDPLENVIYIPMIGDSDVEVSIDKLTLKHQNYAQVSIDPSRSCARFVASFLNSALGKELRELSQTGNTIRRFSLQTLRALPVLAPDLKTQRRMLEIENQMIAEQNTVAALQNEIDELRRYLWHDPKAASQVEGKIKELSRRLSGEVKQHVSATLEQWFETLPFPLASILRAWQATPSQDFKSKYEHLLHFFEGAAEFVSVILLSAFHSNEAVFVPYRQKLTETMQRQNLSFNRATFGTWKLVVEYLGKQTRELLNANGKRAEEAKNDRALCADLFSDPSLSLPSALSRKKLAAIFSDTNKMRNDWGGHGGVVGPDEAESRNQQLLAEVQKLREAFADTWTETQMIRALHCRPRRGVFENEVSILMGSNAEFLKETRAMANWLDVDRLYLTNKDSDKALKLLPLIQVSSSPQSAKNACYFFSRLERDGARFVSYHFADRPELKEQFADATEAINFLSGS
jgi:hypothetical protein